MISYSAGSQLNIQLCVEIEAEFERPEPNELCECDIWCAAASITCDANVKI